MIKQIRKVPTIDGEEGLDILLTSNVHYYFTPREVDELCLFLQSLYPQKFLGREVVVTDGDIEQIAAEALK